MPRARRSAAIPSGRSTGRGPARVRQPARVALLRRARGIGLGRLGRAEEARRELELAAATARGASEDYDVALALDALATFGWLRPGLGRSGTRSLSGLGSSRCRRSPATRRRTAGESSRSPEVALISNALGALRGRGCELRLSNRVCGRFRAHRRGGVGRLLPSAAVFGPTARGCRSVAALCGGFGPTAPPRTPIAGLYTGPTSHPLR